MQERSWKIFLVIVALNYTQICSSNLLKYNWEKILPYFSRWLLDSLSVCGWAHFRQEIQAPAFSAFFMCCYDQTVRAIPRGSRKPTQVIAFDGRHVCMPVCVCGDTQKDEDSREKDMWRDTNTMIHRDTNTGGHGNIQGVWCLTDILELESESYILPCKCRLAISIKFPNITFDINYGVPDKSVSSEV